MARLDVKVSVSKHSYQLANCVAEIIEVVRVALNDGWQPGLDIPMIVTQAIGKLGAGLQGVEAIKDEFKIEDIPATSRAFILPILEVVEQFLEGIAKEPKK